ALDRGASFCRLTAAGATAVADESDLVASERASELTTRALRLTELAADLTEAAALGRRASPDGASGGAHPHRASRPKSAAENPDATASGHEETGPQKRLSARGRSKRRILEPGACCGPARPSLRDVG
ncbi:hypothetical protein Q3H92_03030, partial [Curtobacterium flaccumfaciens]|nr:hypothetical protein [Curtobacterium flaccumfaciens]